MSREPRKTKTEKVDLSVPLNIFDVAKVTEDNCFGREWDPSTDECQSCADSEVCGILKERGVKKGAKAMEKDKGPFLDISHMDRVTDDQISEWITSAPVEITAQDLVNEVLKMARSTDEPSAIERIIRYKATGLITIKKGIVQWQGK